MIVTSTFRVCKAAAELSRWPFTIIIPALLVQCFRDGKVMAEPLR